MAAQPLWLTLHIQLEPLQLNPPIWRRIGGNFDPALFDRRAANAALQRVCNNFWG